MIRALKDMNIDAYIQAAEEMYCSEIGTKYDGVLRSLATREDGSSTVFLITEATARAELKRRARMEAES